MNEPVDHYIDVGELESLYPGLMAEDYRPVFDEDKLIGVHIFFYPVEIA